MVTINEARVSELKEISRTLSVLSRRIDTMLEAAGAGKMEARNSDAIEEARQGVAAVMVKHRRG